MFPYTIFFVTFIFIKLFLFKQGKGEKYTKMLEEDLLDLNIQEKTGVVWTCNENGR
jgi:hypothetical protein